MNIDKEQFNNMKSLANTLEAAIENIQQDFDKLKRDIFDIEKKYVAELSDKLIRFIRANMHLPSRNVIENVKQYQDVCNNFNYIEGDGLSPNMVWFNASQPVDEKYHTDTKLPDIGIPVYNGVFDFDDIMVSTIYPDENGDILPSQTSSDELITRLENANKGQALFLSRLDTIIRMAENPERYIPVNNQKAYGIEPVPQYMLNFSGDKKDFITTLDAYDYKITNDVAYLIDDDTHLLQKSNLNRYNVYEINENKDECYMTPVSYEKGIKCLLQEHMNFCKFIAEDIKKHCPNGIVSKDILEYYDSKGIEIECPLIENTTQAEWIRIHTPTSYIFLYADEDKWNKEGILQLTGRESYDLDLFDEYGAETITDPTFEGWSKQLNEFKDTEKLWKDFINYIELPDDEPINKLEVLIDGLNFIVGEQYKFSKSTYDKELHSKKTNEWVKNMNFDELER